jgi:serine/threonine protein phosphatase PrpC
VQVPELLLQDPHFQFTPTMAFYRACITTNSILHSSDIDDSMSGTTAICVLVCGTELTVANVGDSRAVIAEERDGKLIAVDMSHDQTPMDGDERERCKRAGAIVLSTDQMAGTKPLTSEWTEQVWRLTTNPAHLFLG